MAGNRSQACSLSSHSQKSRRSDMRSRRGLLQGINDRRIGWQLATIRFWVLPSRNGVVSVARITCCLGAIHCERWAKSEPGWRSVPSLFGLLYDGEGGIEITEMEAVEIIESWRIIRRASRCSTADIIRWEI
jgi:hypothetical protein